MYYILDCLLFILAPIICFTVDEAWEVFKGDANDHILYHTPQQYNFILAYDVLERWELVLFVRDSILKELENKRQASMIGSSLQAKLLLNLTEKFYNALDYFKDELRFIYMVAEIELNIANENSIVVMSVDYNKCERCLALF